MVIFATQNSYKMDVSMKMEVEIRDYKSSDYLDVVVLWGNLDLGNPQRGDNSEIIEKTLAMGGKMLVMVRKDTMQIIGTSWITNDGRRLYLHHFGIAKEFQNQGLGDMLVKETLKYSRNLNMQIKLEVAPKNLSAIRLYEKNGFKLLGDYVVYIIRNPGT